MGVQRVKFYSLYRDTPSAKLRAPKYVPKVRVGKNPRIADMQLRFLKPYMPMAWHGPKTVKKKPSKKRKRRYPGGSRTPSPKKKYVYPKISPSYKRRRLYK